MVWGKGQLRERESVPALIFVIPLTYQSYRCTSADTKSGIWCNGVKIKNMYLNDDFAMLLKAGPMPNIS